jgi:DNA-binding response OmpR family regulator
MGARCPAQVLFVEDEASIRTTYARCLQPYENGCSRPALRAVAATRDLREPDVLVLDMRLPDTDGVALLQEIRSSRPGLPVVVTTAYVSMEPLINVLDLGHSGYLVKPFNMDDLAARIDAAG